MEAKLCPGGPMEPLAYIISSAAVSHQKMNYLNISHAEKGQNLTGWQKQHTLAILTPLAASVGGSLEH